MEMNVPGYIALWATAEWSFVSRSLVLEDRVKWRDGKDKPGTETHLMSWFILTQIPSSTPGTRRTNFHYFYPGPVECASLRIKFGQPFGKPCIKYIIKKQHKSPNTFKTGKLCVSGNKNLVFWQP